MRISIMRHGKDGGDRTLADRDFAFSFTESVHGPPWHKLSATLGVGFAEALRTNILPSVRDWIALEDEPGHACMIGRVSSPLAQAHGGPYPSSSVVIEAEGFLDAVRANDIVSSPGARNETVSTLFAYDDWAEKVFANYVDKTFSFGNLGGALQTLVSTVVRMRMPGAFGQRNLGDLIQVLHAVSGEGSAAKIGSPRVLDEVRGYDIGGLRSFLKTRGKVTELLTGTFAPSELLIEMFPSLEPVPSNRINKAPAASSGSFSDTDIAGIPVVLGNYLTIVYRLKPWRVRALTDAARQRVVDPKGQSLTSDPFGGSPLKQPFFTPQTYPGDPSMFDRVTWTESNAITIANPFSMSARKSNNDIVNAAGAWLSAMGSSDELSMFEALGLPILDSAEAIERDGLRVASATWPFLPSPGSDSGGVRESDLLAFIQRLAAQVLQFYQPAADLYSGSFDVGLDLRIRAGEIVKVPVDDGEPMAVYVEAVKHDGHSDDSGVVTGTTSVTYSRGAWASPEGRKIRDVSILLPAIQASEAVSEGSDAGGRHSGVIFNGVEHAIVLNWPFTVDDAMVVPDPSPTTKTTVQNIYGSGVQWATVVESKKTFSTIYPSLTGVAASIEAPVETQDRLFIFGDDRPMSAEIKRRVGLNLDAQPLGVKTSLGNAVKPGAFAVTTINVGGTPVSLPAQWPLVAATGEEYGAWRPNLEKLALEINAKTGTQTIRNAEDITMVVIHSPGSGLHTTAHSVAINTYAKHYKDALTAINAAGSDPTRQRIALGLAVGVQFIIDRKGCVWQLMDALRYCAHSLGAFDVDAGESPDYVNQHSIGIDIIVPSRDVTRTEVEALRVKDRLEMPALDGPVSTSGPDRDSILGGTLPYGCIVPVNVNRAGVSTPSGSGVYQSFSGHYPQPSRQQYRALGALLTAIKMQCPNFQIRFPAGPGALQPASIPEGQNFYWTAIKPNTTGFYDATTLPAGIYIHGCLDKNRTDHLGLNRQRTLAYAGDGSADVVNRRLAADST